MPSTRSGAGTQSYTFRQVLHSPDFTTANKHLDRANGRPDGHSDEIPAIYAIAFSLAERALLVMLSVDEA